MTPSQLLAAFSPGAVVHLCHPFETLPGPSSLRDDVYPGLRDAFPDFERRDTIVMRGGAPDGSHWVGACGYYTGTFVRPWLDIPPTGHQAHMRFHEFFRVEDDAVVEMQAVWDIPELMMQAGVWPMGPSLGREWHVPGPATQDGLDHGARDEARSAASLKLVQDMLGGLMRHAEGGPAAMGLEAYWHPHMNWYGPSGIGTARSIEGFRHWHQIPFLNALPDRDGNPDNGYLFADNHYVGFTGWPGMHMTVSGDGWLGIAPSGQKVTMRSLDFWRVEDGLLKENWVLIDLLHVWAQLGVDVLARMRELARPRLARNPVQKS